MAIGFDNVHMQQHLIDKIQKQAEQEAVNKDEAKPSDVDAFKAQMDDPNQGSRAAQATSATDSTEKVNSESSVKSPGDQILEKLEGVDHDKTSVDASAQSTDQMGVSEELKMQLKVAELGAEESVLSATAGKASKDIDSLLKNQ